MEGQEDPQPTSQESQATSRAADLARLINEDCSRLLELYKERESFPDNKTSEGGPHLVSVAAISSPDELTTVERVWHHRCALRRCLALLEQQISWEEEEMGVDGEGEGEYEELRRAIKLRLGHLLHSTRVLLEAAGDDKGKDHLSPDHDCTQGTEEVDSSNSYNMKIWTHHLLQDLIHWTDSAVKTLHTLHIERTGQQEL